MRINALEDRDPFKSKKKNSKEKERKMPGLQRGVFKSHAAREPKKYCEAVLQCFQAVKTIRHMQM